ncbi:hypothetical protein FRC04_009517 [Tulasnella sp. 424]|nr:hypothetical protein FRC04_009517 [Tulasnella sp. 424]KAG8958057.1 hypothetical protein FRC05_009432 [Tulasnella sp. 425]
MDLAEFTGPIEVASLLSRGGGRGIMAKRDIKFGELLVVSKAFSLCALDAANPEVYAAINLITDSIDSGFSAVAATRIAERIAGNPKAVDVINQLYAGPAQEPPSQFKAVPSEKVNVARLLNFDEDVDVGRIQSVVSFNSFSSQSLKVRGILSTPKNPPHLNPNGLFLLPSLFNHSCAPNSYFYCLGDVMIIRATCDIRAREEVFISYAPQGNSYFSRVKSPCLTKLLGSCDCSLCMQDRRVGEAVCERRDRISNKISSCTTAVAVRSQIKQLEETFKGYSNADQEAMVDAYLALENLYKAKSDYANALPAIFKGLQYVGLQVTDTSLKGALPPRGRDALPIKLVTTAGSKTGSILKQTGVDGCLMVQNIFESVFGDRARAAKWLKGAVWLHDKCFGGGKDLFQERYPHLSHHEDLLQLRLE